MIVLEFFVSGTPRGYSRTGAAHRFTPRAQREWRQMVAREFACAHVSGQHAQQMPRPHEYQGRITLHIDIRGTTADGTNVLKEIEDALNKIAYADDRQIVQAAFTILDAELIKNTVKRRKSKIDAGVNVKICYIDAI